MILKIDRDGEIEVGRVVKCRLNRELYVGEVYSFIGETKFDVILYDKRLKPQYKLDGSFRRKRLPVEKCKLIDENFTFSNQNNYELGDVIRKSTGRGRHKYGVVIGFTHPDGLLSTSYENGYNGTDLIDCVEIERRGLSRKRNKSGELKRFSTFSNDVKICEVDLWDKSGPKIVVK